MSKEYEELDVKQSLLPTAASVSTTSTKTRIKSCPWTRQQVKQSTARFFGQVFAIFVLTALIDRLRIVVTDQVQVSDTREWRVEGHEVRSDMSLQVYWSAPSLDQCAWSHLSSHLSLLDVPSITRSEFLARQAALADALDAADIDAFIAEPSASSFYYANISSSFDLSERPFLMIIDRKGDFSYLAPRFELGRIGGLEMVFDEEKGKTVIEWHEEESPFEALKRATGYEKVMLDEHARYFIATGLEGAGIETVPTSEAVTNMYVFCFRGVSCSSGDTSS